MRDIILKNIVRYTNQSIIFKIFFDIQLFQPTSKHKILHAFDHTFVFVVISSVYVSNFQILLARKFQFKCRESVQRLKRYLQIGIRKILPFFPFVSSVIIKLELETSVLQMLQIIFTRCQPAFEDFNNFLWVFLKLAEFSFNGNSNIPLSTNILKSHYMGICRKENF